MPSTRLAYLTALFALVGCGGSSERPAPVLNLNERLAVIRNTTIGDLTLGGAPGTLHLEIGGAIPAVVSPTGAYAVILRASDLKATLVRISDGNQTVIPVTDGASAAGFSFSPDGASLLFTEVTLGVGPTRLVVFDPATGVARDITPEGPFPLQARYGPTSDTVLYITREQSEVRELTLSSGNSRSLLRVDNIDVQSLSLTPDRRYLALIEGAQVRFYGLGSRKLAATAPTLSIDHSRPAFVTEDGRFFVFSTAIYGSGFGGSKVPGRIYAARVGSTEVIEVPNSEGAALLGLISNP